MAHAQFKNLLVCVCILFPQMTTGSAGTCVATLKNLAVYEGTLNTFIHFPASPKGVKWSFLGTDISFAEEVDIVYNNGTLNPEFAANYAFNSSGLIIKNATLNEATAIGPPPQESTAGLYIAECDGNTFSFKFLIVQKGPGGSIEKLNATSALVICSIIYADTDSNPIPAISKLFVDGILRASDTSPGFNYFGNTRRAELILTMAYNSSSTYKCTQSFGQPTEITDPSVAANAPTFNSNLTIAAPEERLTGKDEENKTSFCTKLYDLPLEMLDVILQKSYLHWVLNSSTKQRDEEVIRSLISIDVCFNQRITRKRFKKAIWSYLKAFYARTKRRRAIIRNNINYLENNIQPTDELLASLLSLNCITDEQSHFIQRHRYTRDKNYELLYVMESFDETNVSNLVTCLRNTDQTTVAKIVESGGGVIKMKVQTPRAKIIHQKVEDLRDRTKPRTYETDKLIVQLRDEGLEILNSQLDGQTVVVWIWCHSQAALENLQTLYESNQLRDIFFEITHTSTCMSTVIDIDRNQFKKTVVVCPISINLTHTIKISGNEDFLGAVTFGVAKLRNEIYVLRRSFSPAASVHVVHVYEDQTPFHFQKEIEIKEIKDHFDIVSSEKESCIYISDSGDKCVWKITRETDNHNKIIKWLITDYEPRTLSVSSGGQLLSINLRCLMIYGSDAELIRSVQLPRQLHFSWHAVETSIGNFVVSHNEVMKEWKHKEWSENTEGHGGSNWRRGIFMLVVSVLTRNGQLITSRIIPSDEPRELSYECYLSLDSDDRMFLADIDNHRVILLDSDLKSYRILWSRKEEKEGAMFNSRLRLCYDKKMKQLIVGGSSENYVSVYSLYRNYTQFSPTDSDKEYYSLTTAIKL